MPNFILTLDCNKGCKYCFAAQTRNQEKEYRHMGLDQFRSLVDKLNPRDPVKLLGGEPTSHPQLKEIFEIIAEKRRQFALISNFLFDEDKLQIVKSAILSNPFHTTLINSTDLDVGNRMEIFSRNYNEIYRECYQNDTEQRISCGITVDTSKNIDYYLNYIDFLTKNLLRIERLRISLAFPGNEENKNDFFFMNNKEIGKMLFILTKKCIDLGITPNLDCIVYPCVFSNKEEHKFVMKFLGKYKSKCVGVPADIFPDNTVSYCYPLKKIAVSTNDFKTLEDAAKALEMKYKIQRSTIDFPETCTKCSFFKREICEGPCLGFFKIDKVI